LSAVSFPAPAPAPKKVARHRERLAIDGGPAVRTEPLPGPYPGALLMGREEERQVLEVLRSKSLFRYYGPDVLGKVAGFEKALSLRLGRVPTLATNSGTSALKCALHAVGVGPGDEVLVPAYSYVASADVVLTLGARPVFVEVDDTLTLDPTDLEGKITPRTRAISPVHLFGVPCDMAPIMEIARRHGIAVVEDCAQSLGATYRGQVTGSFGAIAITSFQLNKVITCGEGGAVWSSDEALFDRAVRLHDHGNFRGKQGGETTVGEGFRLSELSGAVLLAQLDRLDDILGRLRAAKRQLTDKLSRVRGIELCRVPDAEGDAGLGLSFFVRDAEAAARYVAALEAEGIRAMRQYGGKTLYAQAAIAGAGLGAPGQCPRSEALVARSVFLALSTRLGKRDLADIVTAIRKVAGALG
jgi:8-amino-3,8-dideoxy-alpha-D-manno-octulosonate transaminase